MSEDRADRAVAALEAALQRARAEGRREPPGRAGAPQAEARLDALLAALEPVLARLPQADLFDIGLMRGVGSGAPKLCLDMASRVEWEDGYQLSRRTQGGRVTIGRAEDLDGAVGLVCDYLARRIVARERADMTGRAETWDDAHADADEIADEAGRAAGRDVDDAAAWEAAPRRVAAREPRARAQTTRADFTRADVMRADVMRADGMRADVARRSVARESVAREDAAPTRGWPANGAAFEATREAELRAEREALIARHERARLERLRERERREAARWEERDEAPAAARQREPRQAARDATQDRAQYRAQDRAQDSANDSAQNSAKDRARNAAQDSAQDSAQDAANDGASGRGWRARLGGWRKRFGGLRPGGRLRGVSERLARRRVGAGERALVFAVQFLGSAALTLIVALTAWWAWKSIGVGLPK